jgi:transcription elongation GreA/GreB family factor
MNTFKTSLYHACLERLDQTIVAATKAMNDVQDDANQETKSSAGDKYETSRAMLQQEKDKHALQLAQALDLRQQLERLDPAVSYSDIQLGSLVRTSEGDYYLAVSLGKMQVEGKTVYVLSAAAPLGQVLLHQKVGDTIVFQGRKIEILALW